MQETRQKKEDDWPHLGGTSPATDPTWINSPVPTETSVPTPPTTSSQNFSEPQRESQAKTNKPSTVSPAKPTLNRTSTHSGKYQSQTRRAGFMIRSLAFSIDLALLFAITVGTLLLSSVVYNMGDVIPIEKQSILSALFNLPYSVPEAASSIFLLFFLLSSSYFVFFHATLSQTPGKLALGLRVVTYRDRPLTYREAFFRWATFLLSLALFGLGLLWTAFSEVKQGLHDKIAGTYVVHT